MANKQLVGILAAAVVYAVWTFISNPHQEFSTEDYWRDATVSDVEIVPQAALERGNNSGPVLMWAASVTQDPRVIAALIKRGAMVNEADSHTTRTRRGGTSKDPRIGATALSAAASQSTSPQVIAELVKHGAKLDTRVSHGRTALMVAASINRDERITLELLKQGANATLKSDRGKTALDIARQEQNFAVVKVLEQQLAEAGLDE